MSSTRKAKDASIFHQSRYASSPEFERGLIANLVAKRCALLDAKADRELIWFLQYLSHRPGGMAAVAKDLIAKYPERLQTQAMADAGARPGKLLDAEQVRKIRRQMPEDIAADLILKGEIQCLDGTFVAAKPLDEKADSWMPERGNTPQEIADANQHPEDYPAEWISRICRHDRADDLEKYLCKICLDPAVDLADSPWFFYNLTNTLREYLADFISSKSAGVFTTALGQKVFEVLDYTAFCRGLTLIEGGARLGKSHAGRAWCEQHPGSARFVEVPSGNDDATFFRDLARGLGLGNFLNYKVVQIRERVESVLLTGDILLVMDEAQRLWPQKNLREGFPGRIVWVMTMANAGVPICMISTPQFLVTQKAVEKKGWNSAQLTGRISHYEPLPADLSEADLTGVARAVLPESAAKTLRALAVYARSSARYLAAIDSIAKRARYIAMRAGRNEATADDVASAMRESVIPADTKLHRALDSASKGKPGRITPALEHPAQAAQLTRPPETETSHAREIAPAKVPGSRNRAGNSAPLIVA
jgi:hypothetical protein